MSKPLWTQEFRDEAVRQVTERNYSASEVGTRLGISVNTLYNWPKNAVPSQAAADDLAVSKLEIQQLKSELKRAQEERDILKNAAIFARDPK